MSEVAVHRCVLRIRRTAGWAWGAKPDALLAAATVALPSLLAKHLAEVAARATSPVHIRQPIQIRIAGTVAELAALATLTGESDGGSLAGRMSAQLAEQIASEVGREIARSEDTAHVDHHAIERDDTAEAAATVEEHEPVVAAARALAAWWRTGAIASVLRQLSDTLVPSLERMMLGDPRSAATTSSVSAELLDVARAAATSSLVRELQSTDRKRVRVALVAAMLAHDPRTTPAQLRAVVDRVIPGTADEQPVVERNLGTDEDRAASIATTDDEDVAPAAGASASVQERSPAVRVTQRVTEIEVHTVLPFLLLPPLHHAGWLDALAAMTALPRLSRSGLSLAAGLAGKVLDPPERGWMRSRADRILIAAFTGETEPVADEKVVASGVTAAGMTGVLDETLRRALVRARPAGAPLLLWRGSRGWLLVESDGLAVLAAGDKLHAVMAAAGETPVLVPAMCVEASTLDTIDLANARFITDAPPSRGEVWRPVAGVDRRLWTNDTSSPAGKLAAIAAPLGQLSDLAAELAEVFDARPAIARDPSSAIDATCTLAVTAALADLGARLFPNEPCTPILALTRFRSLDARVRFEPDTVRVRIPLGRRHADLLRHGFMTTLDRVPWLGGRALDLGGA